MAGLDRVIDPLTKDYVSDGAGGRQKTRDASTAIYHQFLTRLGKWIGDVDAGSRFFTLDRAKNPISSPLTIQDIATEALTPLVDAERITAPTFRSDRSLERVITAIDVTDIQSGESLNLLNLLPLSF